MGAPDGRAVLRLKGPAFSFLDFCLSCHAFLLVGSLLRWTPVHFTERSMRKPAGMQESEEEKTWQERQKGTEGGLAKGLRSRSLNQR